ncbi:MAG TPA: hemerythrin domain-containing protein [Acidimicrobiales bacterium]
MSIVDPHRNLLEAVVAADHQGLGSVLVELGRTPETPGVVAELLADVDHRVRVHMAVVERVLLPPLTGEQRGHIADQVVANHDLVRRDLARLHERDRDTRTAVRDLESDLADQVAYEDGVVVPAVEDAVGLQGADGLAFAYSRMIDSGVSSPAGPLA